MIAIDKTCPFKVFLGSKAEENSVQCEQLLRALPGKRLVYKGTWRGRSVLIKLFLDPKSSLRHWRREKIGVEALKGARISTPDLFFSGRLEDGTPVLVFDFLPSALTALEVWDDLT